MIDYAIEILLILLLIFTPMAFGSQLFWAFSLMELGVLLIIILGAVKVMSAQLSADISKVSNQSSVSSNQLLVTRSTTDNESRITNPQSLIPNNYVLIPTVVLALFLGLVLFQIVPLPEGIVRFISSKTYELRNQLSAQISGLSSQSFVTTLSFFPFATKVEFFKWLALAGLFIFLLRWKLVDKRYRVMNHLIIVIFLVGVVESLYGIFEFFSGHRHILNMDWSHRVSSVTGTFVNRNYFAGYLLMVIPLSIGFFFARDADQPWRLGNWRHRLSSLDGKTLLLGFGLILMILGLLLSASRMGIVSLLVSFSLISLLFRDPRRGQRISKVPVLIFGLALLWAAWIGLDAVMSRFFAISEGLESRWMIWANTFGILKDFPLLGSGLGTFTEVFSMYRSFHIVGLITHAENDFLQLASEVGLLGAGLLLILFVFLFSKAASGIRSLSQGKPQRYIGIGGLVGVLALMFHSIVERNIQVPANAFLYAVMWAMVLTVALEPRSKRIAPKEQESKE